MRKVPISTCPYCGYVADSVSPADPNDHDTTPPTPDSAVTLCFGCGGVMMFNDDLTVRAPSPEEMAMLKSDPKIWFEITASQLILRRMIKRRRKLH
jgi:hypothetical protein